MKVSYTLSTPRMIEARSTGVSADTDPMPAEALLFTPSSVTPSLFFSASIGFMNMPKTPIEPVSVVRSATITSAGQEM